MCINRGVTITLMGLMLLGSVDADAKSTSKRFTYGKIDKITASSALQLEIERGESGNELWVESEWKNMLKIDYRNNVLKLRRVSSKECNCDCDCNDMPTLRLKLTHLPKIKLSGAVFATIKGFGKVQTADFTLSGASGIEGKLDANKAMFHLSGASRIELDGQAQALQLKASGASQVQLGDFQLHQAKADVSGASHATIHVKGTLDADVSGVSKLSYAGKPKLGKVQTSGMSKIRAL